MTKNDFIIKLHKLISYDNINIYRDLYENTKIEDVTDEYWKESQVFYNTLTQAQKEVLFKMLRQIAVEATVETLGVLDGTSSLDDGGNDGFNLAFSAKPNQLINGDLQELFLQFEEDGEL